jgi:hypothetical protein
MSRLRELLHQVVDELADQLECQQSAAPSDYYDQTDSPLPRDTHCRLVREGKLPGSKVNGRVLVLRRDMDAFIAQYRVKPHVRVVEQDADAIVAASLKKLGLRRAG